MQSIENRVCTSYYYSAKCEGKPRVCGQTQKIKVCEETEANSALAAGLNVRFVSASNYSQHRGAAAKRKEDKCATFHNCCICEKCIIIFLLNTFRKEPVALSPTKLINQRLATTGERNNHELSSK